MMQVMKYRAKKESAMAHGRGINYFSLGLPSQGP